MPTNLPEKIEEQIKNAGLPRSGAVSYEPKLAKNRHGESIIEKILQRNQS